MFSGSARFRGAYLNTDYIVPSDGDVVAIRIGMVDRLLSRFKARSAVFITAFISRVKDEAPTAIGRRSIAFSHLASLKMLRLHWDAASDRTRSYASDTGKKRSCLCSDR